MLKKTIFLLLLFFIFFPFTICASSAPLAKIGNNYYDNLEDAIKNASSTDIIELTSNVSLDKELLINKEININLNGNDITSSTNVFLVQGGTLNVSGKGMIKETNPNYGVIKVIGSNTYTEDKYSIVNIEKDVTLEGWSGLFISHDKNKSYGVFVYFDGKINAVSDINGGTGIGIYVNGNIKDENSAPIVNIFDNAEIYSNGNGLYIGGYSIFYIGKAYIQGNESGIGIKSGILNIDGATVICDGKDTTPTEGYNNGINASGTTIQIESNTGYAGNIELNISEGTFKSKNSSVIYEYIGKGNNTLVKSISISGGTFISEASKNVFLFSNSLNNLHSSFISGGKYSSDPNMYLKSGYTSNLDGSLYNVSKISSKEVFLE